MLLSRHGPEKQLAGGEYRSRGPVSHDSPAAGLTRGANFSRKYKTTVRKKTWEKGALGELPQTSFIALLLTVVVLCTVWSANVFFAAQSQHTISMNSNNSTFWMEIWRSRSVLAVYQARH